MKNNTTVLASIVAILVAAGLVVGVSTQTPNAPVVPAPIALPAAPVLNEAPVIGATGVALVYLTGTFTPDPIRTPGALNPDVNQGNISQNICNPSWSTKSIRPPVSYTTPLKIKQIGEYGYTDTKTASYEEDHLISLELGGSPTDPANLWPEPYVINAPDGKLAGAHEKDKVENYLHKQVCAGKIPLTQAQHEIATDWYAVYVSAGL